VALIVAGVVLATTPVWVQATHVIGGTNWATILQMPLLVAGGGLALAGVVLFAVSKLEKRGGSFHAIREGIVTVR
jgi:hypothetical protein